MVTVAFAKGVEPFFTRALAADDVPPGWVVTPQPAIKIPDGVDVIVAVAVTVADAVGVFDAAAAVSDSAAVADAAGVADVELVGVAVHEPTGVV
jgi:hypothetical protein